MENLFELLNQYSSFILLGMAILILLQFILIIIVLIKLSKLTKKYNKMMRGTNNKNLEEFITNYLYKIDDANAISERISSENKILQEKLKKCVQKTGIVRYRAFDNVGGDLSFSVALLDENNDGIVLTGIYGRDYSPTYAKPINSGTSKYDLSEEEKTALNEAMKK